VSKFPLRVRFSLVVAAIVAGVIGALGWISLRTWERQVEATFWFGRNKDEVAQGLPRRGDAFRVRQGDQGSLALQVEGVEEERGQRQLGAGLRHTFRSSEPAHGHLEGMRPPVGTQGDGFTLQNHLARAEGAGPLDDLRNAGGDVLELTGEDADLTPALCTWMRAPSILYSKDASPNRSSASPTSSAGFASMGAMGLSIWSE
jgi:hypothetical protein